MKFILHNSFGEDETKKKLLNFIFPSLSHKNFPKSPSI